VICCAYRPIRSCDRSQHSVPHFLLSALNEPVQVLIESALPARTSAPGVGAGVGLPPFNPITLAVNLIKSIPTSHRTALEELGVAGNWHDPSGPYVVGGPAAAAPQDTMATRSASKPPNADSPALLLAKERVLLEQRRKKPRRHRIPPRPLSRAGRRNPLRRRLKPAPSAKSPISPIELTGIEFDLTKRRRNLRPHRPGGPTATGRHMPPPNKADYDTRYD